jgi:hypothetical protein
VVLRTDAPCWNRLEQESARAARNDGRLFRRHVRPGTYFKRINDTLGQSGQGDDVLAVFHVEDCRGFSGYDSIGRYVRVSGGVPVVITPATGKPEPRCLFETSCAREVEELAHLKPAQAERGYLSSTAWRAGSEKALWGPD